MQVIIKALVWGLLVVMSQLSVSDARAGGRSRTELGERNITAPVASLRAATATTPPACSGGKPGCIDCTTKGKCDAAAGTLTPDGTCPPDEACTMVGSIPVCRPIADTKCNCGGNKRGCDPFANRPIFCVGRMVYLDEPCASGQCSGAGECVAGNAPTATSDPAAACVANTGMTFRLLTPVCTTGVLCADSDVITTMKCMQTQYFDLPSASCKAFPPPNPCGCGQPKCPIIGDCTKYAVCDGNTLIDEKSCSYTAANKFDFANQECAAVATGLCVYYQDCAFPSETSDDSSFSGSPSSSSPSSSSPSSSSPSSSSPSSSSPSSSSPSSSSPSSSFPSSSSSSSSSPSSSSTVPSSSSSGSSSSGSPSTGSFQCKNQCFSFSGSFSSVSSSSRFASSVFSQLSQLRPLQNHQLTTQQSQKALPHEPTSFFKENPI